MRLEEIRQSRGTHTVSIHAPWEGCDTSISNRSRRSGCFNSRTLGRVRLQREIQGFQRDIVSIHAPWEGCDKEVEAEIKQLMEVSIHAPWEGCDYTRYLYSTFFQRFNSRTLGRVRLPRCLAIDAYSIVFQFTHPGKGATKGDLKTITEHIKFQFTHPGKGATLPTWVRYPASSFQFTHPGKGATCFTIMIGTSLSRFNSRTLGRVRLFGVNKPNTKLKFQFTHPGKGATALDRTCLPKEDVSIHAPWEGCDDSSASR